MLTPNRLRCPRCNGQLVRDHDQLWCPACGSFDVDADGLPIVALTVQSSAKRPLAYWRRSKVREGSRD